jgi:UMF1 family MFS transporter
VRWRSRCFGWIVMIASLAVAAHGGGLFWVAAVIAGLCMGSSQSAGRAMAGLLAPAAPAGRVLRLWTFAVRLSTYGLVTWVTGGNHRLAIASTGLFFVAGLWLLRRVDVERGAREALRPALDASP